MAQKQINSNHGKRNVSGKKTTPGQFSLQFDDDDKILSELITEPQPELCTPYYSRKYWEAFRDFLDASGVAGRTWHLYRQMKQDPDPKELSYTIANTTPGEYRNNLEEQLQRVQNRINVMVNKQRCPTIEDLHRKVKRDWSEYETKLDTLIGYANDANVPINIGRKTRRNILLSFILLDDNVRGSCRREYYRKTFVNRSLRKIETTGYADPVSIFEIEEEYANDTEWQEKFLRRVKH